MKSSFQYLLFAAVALTINSCGNSDNKSTETIQPDTSTIEPKDSTQLAVPSVLFSQNVEILLPTQYRKESTGYPKGVKEKEWYEIYKDAKTGKWNIGKAELNIGYGRDECVGEDVMIIKSPHEDAVLFFTPFEGLSENPVTVLENKPLIPGNPVNFKMNDKKYSLLPSGTNNEGKSLSVDDFSTDYEGNIYIDANKYKLSFGSDEAKNYSIAEIEEMRDVTPKIIWAGDLNGDGLPDMILNLSAEYESYHLYFFLSDKNDREKPLKKVVDLLVVNDC